MHVVIKLVVTLITKLDLFQVDFDSNIAHVNVLQTEVFLQTISTLVCDVSESIEKLFGPILEEWDLREQGLAQIRQKFLEWFALFYLEKVLIVVGV